MSRIPARRPAAVAVALTLGLALSVSASPIPSHASTSPIYTEIEPPGGAGANDVQADAEPVPGRQAQIHGNLLERPPALDPTTLATPSEDDGWIPLATPTGIDGTGAVQVDGVIGDGLHGLDGDNTGDVDVYEISAGAESRITVSARRNDEAGLFVVALYRADGTRLLADNNVDYGAAVITYDVPTAGSYFALVGAATFTYPDQTFPRDPFDSGSGTRPDARRLGYTATIRVDQPDRDYYRIDLAKGDVLGFATGGGADDLAVLRPDGTRR